MITPEMTIEDILNNFPAKSQRLAHEMASSGLSCVGCGAATWETLEEGMTKHGFSSSEITELTAHLNKILAEQDNPETITLTPAAAEKFSQILTSQNKTGYALRFGIKKGGCGGSEYIFDFSKNPSKEDMVFSSHGVDIHIEKALLEKLLGSCIDYVDSLMGGGFKVSNPNVKRSCGCGNSQIY